MKRTVCGVLFVMLVAGCASPRCGQDLQVHQLVKSCKSWDGEALPAYRQGKPEITILRITIPPGYSLPDHTHPVINAGVLIRGELTVKTDSGKVLHLKPYDPIVEVVGTWHYGKNEGTEPAEIIVFYAGTEGDNITVKKVKKQVHGE